MVIAADKYDPPLPIIGVAARVGVWIGKVSETRKVSPVRLTLLIDVWTAKRSPADQDSDPHESEQNHSPESAMVHG